MKRKWMTKYMWRSGMLERIGNSPGTKIATPNTPHSITTPFCHSTLLAPIHSTLDRLQSLSGHGTGRCFNAWHGQIYLFGCRFSSGVGRFQMDGERRQLERRSFEVHIDTLSEVLHRVLYPKAHRNGS